MQRLREMKPQIDARAPKSSGMAHLKTNFKRDEVLGCRYDEIERDNRHLLAKMSHVTQEHGQGTPSRSHSLPNLSSASRAEKFPGVPARKNEIARIEYENQRMLGRLQNAQAEYRTKDWEAAHDRSRGYLRRICEYPVREDIGRMPRKGLPSASLIPINADTDVTLQASMNSGAVASDYYAPPAGLRYVLKEERYIGEQSFFVEMATDGQTLAVSAFDRELQDTLELLVNEDNHRQLFAESDGDYAQIADRLRVSEDRLVIIPLEAYDLGEEVDEVDYLPEEGY